MTKIPVRYADKPDLTTNRFNKILDDLEKQGTNHPTNMTDDLTKKLNETLRELGGDWYHDGQVFDPTDDIENCAKCITQAFIDAGWFNSQTLGETLYKENVSHANRILALLKNTVDDSTSETVYMTGQEWYNRFLNALTGEVLRTDKRLPQLKDCEFVFDAAKKASGLTQ